MVTRSYSPRNLLGEVIDDSDPGELWPHELAYGYDGRGIRVVRAENPSNGGGTVARRSYVYSPELQLLSVTREDGINLWGGNPPSSFGNVYIVREGTRTDQPLRFPGQELAMTWEGPEENYNIFRWYKSSSGRYTQPDPLLGKDPNANDVYGYARENPLSYTDPTGMLAEAICADIAVAVHNHRHATVENVAFSVRRGGESCVLGAAQRMEDEGDLVHGRRA